MLHDQEDVYRKRAFQNRDVSERPIEMRFFSLLESSSEYESSTESPRVSN